MASRELDLDELGRRIEGIVDRAVSSHDYQKLNQTIRQVVEKAVDAGNEAVRRVSDSAAVTELRQHNVRSSIERRSNKAQSAMTVQENRALAVKQLYGKTGGKTAVGIVKTVIGGELSLAGVTLFVLSLALSGSVVGAALSAALLGGSLCLMSSGIRTLARLKRFRKYKNMLGTQTHCTVESLASGVAKNEKFVRKDLNRMIGSGYFLEGHLDKEGKTLITSNETYKYYEQSRLAYEARKQLQAAKPAPAPVSVPAPAPQKQSSALYTRGEAFLMQLRDCNDRIPGVEISEKISRIELLVQKIFDWAKEHPEVEPDLKKMMDYYLPMTVKLLNAYADMDAQPVQGQTILASKKEIEETLDTLTLAFEKLLDSVFQNVALDVSSDISVLNTLLAQEGLKDDELNKMRNKNEGFTLS